MSFFFYRQVMAAVLALPLAALPVAAEKLAPLVVIVDSEKSLSGKVPDASLTDRFGQVQLTLESTAGNLRHGKDMAEIVANGTSLAEGCGGCRIVPIKATIDAVVDLEIVARAVDQAVAIRADVILLALGATEDNAALRQALVRAAAAGIQIVAPLAEPGSDTPLYPAAYDTVFSVRGLGLAGRPLDLVEGRADFAVPGHGNRLRDGRMLGGGSVSAALVAGLLARNSANRPDVVPVAVNPPNPERVVPPHLMYADTDDEDVILDAPWRTMRDYLPVLVFAAELSDVNNSVRKIEISNYNDRADAISDVIFSDEIAGENDFVCNSAAGDQAIEIIDPDGFARAGVGSNEAVTNHWHYIVRVPTSCIGVGSQRGLPGTHLVEAKVDWIKKSPLGAGNGVPIELEVTTRHVMRIVVEAGEMLPRFNRIDRHYDIHYHTIAEQTRGGTINIDSARRAFGGPLAMIVEAGYALGMVDQPLRNGNWAAFRDQIATTDHNVFFSGGANDSGHPPRFGPTSNTDGQGGEYQWYRDNFGTLGGQELALEGSGRSLSSARNKRLGSHFLVYGAPKFEGPWHGGHYEIPVDFLGVNLNLPGINTTGAVNNLELPRVLREMGAVDAFGYAAHPQSNSIGWSDENFDRALGFAPFNTPQNRSALVNAQGTDFVFKGSQVWNGKEEWITLTQQAGGDLPVSLSNNRNPFAASGMEQHFVFNPSWDSAMLNTFGMYLQHVKRGLRYSFSEQPDHIFSRKVYMSAGTDAHGDFNHKVHNAAVTAVAEAADFLGVDADLLNFSSNAFGRARTYTLAGDRAVVPGSALSTSVITDAAATGNDVAVVPGQAASAAPNPDAAHSVAAYRDGNIVLTDGPICSFHVDTNCRFNSDSDVLAWDDGNCAFKNRDGSIGGIGRFDGGRTALVARENPDIWLRHEWKGRNHYFPSGDGGPEDIRLETLQITPTRISTIPQPAGARGKAFAAPMSGYVSGSRAYEPSALLLKGELGSGERRSLCMTNPIWTAPYKISVNPNMADETCPFDPGEFKVTVSFGISMNSLVRAPTCTNCLVNPDGHRPFFGAQIMVKPLNGQGKSGTTTFVLGQRRWFDNNLSGPGFQKIADASMTAVNLEHIPCPTQNWDAISHAPVDGARSYGVIVTDIVDQHDNRLNSIATSYATKVFRPQLNQRFDGRGGLVAPVD